MDQQQMETLLESYAAELANRMEAAHEKLRAQQLLIRSGDRQEEPSFKAGQLVWLKTKRFSRGQSHKLQPKYTGPYEVKEATRNHTSSSRTTVVAERRRAD